MSYDTEHYYALHTFLEDDELHKIWNIVEKAMNRHGFDVSNSELSMRLYDQELEDNIEFANLMIGDMSPRELFEFAIHRVTCDVAMMKQEELKDHIDEYDEYAYEILEDYVTDAVGSYEIYQEFMQERHANDWGRD